MKYSSAVSAQTHIWYSSRDSQASRKAQKKPAGSEEINESLENEFPEYYSG
jgi:hypothetical protein